MKRYRVINVDIDSRASMLKIEIQDSWEPRVQELHKQNKEKTREELIEEYGSAFAEVKIQNLVDLGDAPFSILAFHNKFLHQIRQAFMIGSYYPALTSACSLGERILNHLLLNLRDFYRSEPNYKKIYRKSSFDNWQLVIGTLEDWQILLPILKSE